MRGGPHVVHLDDVPAEEMLRFEFADGHTASIWEKWIEMSPRYFAFWNKWDPGAMTPRHGHTGDHINLILAGEIRCGDVGCGPGTHVMLEWGDLFGPWEAGPDGCELYGFIAGEGYALLRGSGCLRRAPRRAWRPHAVGADADPSAAVGGRQVRTAGRRHQLDGAGRRLTAVRRSAGSVGHPSSDRPSGCMRWCVAIAEPTGPISAL